MRHVCVVIPCFNEEHRLRGADILAFLDTRPDAGVCLVNDGSRDHTLGVLEQLRRERPAQILVRDLAKNGGKAEAVRQGVRHAAAHCAAPFLGFWDADLSTPLAEVDRLLEAFARDSRCQLALGSRVKRLGSRIDRRTSRHVLGRIFAAFASATLGLSVYDSQCGAKLFRREVVEVLFAEPFVTRWLFDLEMLMRLRNRVGREAMEATTEVPLREWREVGGSKLSLADMAAVPIELLKIRARYNL
jgi:glycosyltransferase involved in cell wall biosynthesis